MTLTEFITADEDSTYVEEQMRLEAEGVMSRAELTAFYGEGGTFDHLDVPEPEEDE